MRESLDIEGTWEDEFGSAHDITAFEWSSVGWGSSLFHISDASNEEGWLVAQNDEDNEYNPELWSKFEWAWDDDGNLYYCQSTYAAATEEDAFAAARTDADDLDGVGCGGFPWTWMYE